jgi:Arrestin (or S-antigen), N-terminal domain
LDLRIWLEKNTYDAGETAKGTLLIKADSRLKVQKIKFLVCGKERYLEETKRNRRGIVGGLGRSREKEKYDIFFVEDLSPFLKSTSSFSYIGDKIEVSEGSTAIPFHFTIPSNTLESYRGKYARIAYDVEVRVEMGRWKRDEYVLAFEVKNPKMTYTFEDSLYLEKEEDKKEDQLPLRFELEAKNSTSDIPKFSSGEIIQGRLMIENIGVRRVMKAVIQLYSVEYSKWRNSRIIYKNIKEEIKYDKNRDMDTIAFGIQIPKNVKRSYNAKHSEYYWILDTHVEISNSPVFHTKKVVQIV